MPDIEIPADVFFPGEAGAAAVAGVPHLITALDSPLLNAVARINGSKPGIWNEAAPYDENDQYQPHRESSRFSEWALGYNQNELMKSDAFGHGTMIVDSALDETVLNSISERLPDNESGGGYESIPDFAGALKQIGWALIPLKPSRPEQPSERALFAVAESKKDYIGLLQHWCHQNGRAFYTLAPKDNSWVVVPRAAPEQFRKHAARQQGQQLLMKLAVFGIAPQEAKAHFAELVDEWQKAAE